MDDGSDPYDVLGISRQASTSDTRVYEKHGLPYQRNIIPTKPRLKKRYDATPS
jgi:peroxiredoxin